MSVHIPIRGRLGGRQGRPRKGEEVVIGYAVVDDEDHDLAMSVRWHSNQRGYVVGRLNGERVSLHRLVAGLTPGDGVECDHINRNPLDNQRANLRIATTAQNSQNRGSHRDSSSSYRGVFWATQPGKWRAVVGLNGVRHHLGDFDDELEAARAAARFRAEHMPFSVEDPALLEQAA